MQDYRYAPPPPMMLATQRGLPGFGIGVEVIFSDVPPVHECVCGVISARPLPRCRKCQEVICIECREECDPSLCSLCYGFGYPL